MIKVHFPNISPNPLKLFFTINTPLPYSISPPPHTHTTFAFGAKLSTLHFFPHIFSLHFLRHSQEKKKNEACLCNFPACLPCPQLIFL
nr:hypothetical protein CFP56_79675 [Quercus suber]